MVSNTAKGNFLFVEQSKIHLALVQMNVYSRSSRKRSPRKFENVVVTRAGRLRERVLVSDRMVNTKARLTWMSYLNA